jgi:trk system potassium uptake protein TrkH
MLVDLSQGSPDWTVFFFCALATSFFGGIMFIGTSGAGIQMRARQGFLLITSGWVLISLFSALPFWLSAYNLSLADAVFEAVSGITTTGGTIIVGLDKAPPGLLIWRSILQWLGGIGVILMALSIMPFLKVGGMQLFKTEIYDNEKAVPRLTQLAIWIAVIYAFLTLLCAIAYDVAGMSSFDAFAHAMTTISTGGYSTYDTSFSHYKDPWLEIIAIVFMIIGGLPFVLYLKAVRGNMNPLLRDTQVRWFLSILALTTLCLTFYLTLSDQASFADALRRTAFNVVSIMTGTGYMNGDYSLWGNFPVSILFFLMVVGGCAGSTSCGIKIFRFQVLYAVTVSQVRQLLHPNGIFIPHYNRKPLPSDVATSVMSFFFLFGFCFAMTALALAFVGLDFMTAMSGAATAISNMGPGLGSIIGPAGTFAPLPDSAKWILSVAMLLGRLEIFTVLVLFTPQFWRQ